MLFRLNRLILCIYFCLLFGKSFAQLNDETSTTPPIAAQGRAFADSVLLRWAPTTAEAWETQLAYGYWVQRYTVEIDADPVEVYSETPDFKDSVRPRPLAEWSPWLAESKYGAVAAQALYGERFTLSITGESMEGIQFTQAVQELFHGTVLDAHSSDPIAYARISVVGHGTGAVSDKSGNFYLYASPGDTVMIEKSDYGSVKKVIDLDIHEFKIERESTPILLFALTPNYEGIYSKAGFQKRKPDTWNTVIEPREVVSLLPNSTGEEQFISQIHIPIRHQKRETVFELSLYNNEDGHPATHSSYHSIIFTSRQAKRNWVNLELEDEGWEFPSSGVYVGLICLGYYEKGIFHTYHSPGKNTPEYYAQMGYTHNSIGATFSRAIFQYPLEWDATAQVYLPLGVPAIKISTIR